MTIKHTVISTRCIPAGWTQQPATATFYEEIKQLKRNRIWDRRFLSVADLVATWSKDPSTQVGAVIVDANRRIVSQGYNGFPIGTDDDPAIYDDRNRKYKRVLHAEKNALLFAQRDLSGCTLYVTHPACGQCMAAAIQMGIARIVSRPASADMKQRWTDEFAESRSMAEEAGVILEAIDAEDM